MGHQLEFHGFQISTGPKTDPAPPPSESLDAYSPVEDFPKEYGRFESDTPPPGELAAALEAQHTDGQEHAFRERGERPDSALTFCLFISHTPWVPARVESLKRLEAQLHGSPLGPPEVVIWAERAPNHTWSEHMWLAATRENTTHCVFLQDDITVAPRFWEILTAMVAARPDEPICLESVHQTIPLIAETGTPGVYTPDGMIGPGYVVPREWLAEAIQWKNTCLDSMKRAALNKAPRAPFGEDTLLGFFAAWKGTQIFQPIPAIIDHGSESSTYGNDGHARRRPLVRWDNLDLSPEGPEVLENPAYWAQPAPHVGLFYPSTPGVMRDWIPGLARETFLRLKRDNGAELARRITYTRRAANKTPAARIFVATPTRGPVAREHVVTLLQLARDEETSLETSWELVDSRYDSDDLVRVRSRFVRHFLEETDATHLLFLDADIALMPKVIRGMLRVNKDFVSTPYPQREGIPWAVALEHMKLGNPPETAYHYKVIPLGGPLEIQEDCTAEVARVGLGCALLSREMLETMCDAYSPSLVFDDEATGSETVALFNLMFYARPDKRRALLSEDFSFCERVRDCGYKIHIFLGEGSPADHVGSMVYRGALEAFGIRRNQ